jgi:hypothetical protein
LEDKGSSDGWVFVIDMPAVESSFAAAVKDTSSPFAAAVKDTSSCTIPYKLLTQ